MAASTGASADGPCLIGIDCGTQSVRAIAFDAAGNKLAAAARPTPLQRRDSGGEYDPDAIFAAVLATLAEIAEALAGRPVAGIAAASIGESCVLIDAEGRSLAPSIAWFDRRALPETRQIAETFGEERLFAITGHAADPSMTLFKLAWMRTHWPEALARAAAVLLMADWIAYRLSGVAATDHSLASRTQYFAIHERRWSPELIAFAGASPDVLPSIMASGAALAPMRGELLAETGLAGTPIVAVGGHDHVVGLFAAGIVAPGTLLDSLGTAEAVILVTPETLADPEVLRRGYAQGAIATDRSLSFITAGLATSGGAMEWCRRLLGDVPHATLIAEAGAVPPGSRGVAFLPDLVNGPPPAPDPLSRGAFVGLSTAVDRGTLYRAVLEGIALQARILVDGMATLPGVTPPEAIRVIGGGSRNPLLLGIKANVFGRPLTVVEEAEATALGAALLGGVAAGVYPGLDAALATLARRERVIEPDAAAGFYDALRQRVFARLHRDLQGVNRALLDMAPAAAGGPASA